MLARKSIIEHMGWSIEDPERMVGQSSYLVHPANFLDL